MKKSSYTDPRIVLFSNYIKYNELNRMTTIGFSDTSGDRLNIYIDLTKIFRSLLKFDTMPDNELVSTIVNMTAHYISFYKKMGVRANVYLVYSNYSADCNHLHLVGFNKEIAVECYTVDTVFKPVIEKLKALCQYLPRTFFCQRNCETITAIYALILDHKKNNDLSPSLVISGDMFAWQLVGHDETPYVAVFNPNGDVITSKNVMSVVSLKSNFQTYPFEGLHSGLLSLYWSLTNVKSRGLNAMFNAPTAIRVIRNGLDKRVILNNHNVLIDKLIPDVATIKNASGHRLDRRYQLVDVVNQYYMYDDRVCLHNFSDVNIFLNDPLAVQGLMDLFVDNPLDINRLE